MDDMKPYPLTLKEWEQIIEVADFRESNHRFHLKAIIVFIPGDQIGAKRRWLV